MTAGQGLRRAISTLLPIALVVLLAVDPVNASTVYAGTDGRIHSGKRVLFHSPSIPIDRCSYSGC